MYLRLITADFKKWNENQIKNLNKVCEVYLVYSDDNPRQVKLEQLFARIGQDKYMRKRAKMFDIFN